MSLPLTDFIESIINLSWSTLNLASSSFLPFPYPRGVDAMNANNVSVDMMLPSSYLPYSAPVFYTALLVNYINIFFSLDSSGS